MRILRRGQDSKGDTCSVRCMSYTTVWESLIKLFFVLISQPQAYKSKTANIQIHAQVRAKAITANLSLIMSLLYKYRLGNTCHRHLPSLTKKFGFICKSFFFIDYELCRLLFLCQQTCNRVH